MDNKVNLAEKFSLIRQPWTPHVVGELNGQHVKLAMLEGEFCWHHHQHEDELFLVVEGELELHLPDRVIRLAAGELFVVPRGVEHKPVVPHGQARVLLFEPATTLNTGNVKNELTRSTLKRI